MTTPLVERSGSPHSVWEGLAGPYRAAAEGIGFRFLDRTVSSSEPEIYTCCDVLIHPDATFLDLVGAVVEGRPKPGTAHGLLFAQLRTWIEDGGRPKELLTVARPEPGPRAYGCAAFVLQIVARPVLDLVLPRELRPLPLRVPGDLALAFARHRELRASKGGRILRPGSDPLGSRDRWSRGPSTGER